MKKIYDIETLAVLPSFGCDAACHHCVFTSSPKLKSRLSLDAVTQLIRDTRKLTTVRRVTVSGGEAFSDYDYLRDVAKVVSEERLLFRVITNASFAVSESVVTERIKELSEWGIELIGISWDKFHEKFIPANSIKNLIRVCRKLDVRVNITSVITKKNTLSEDLSKLGDEAFEIPVTQVKCLPVGRAEKAINISDLLEPAESDKGRSCKTDFDTLSVTHDGNIYPCCAVGGFTDGIVLGNCLTESLEDILNRRNQTLKWKILELHGPQYFARFAKPDELNEMGASLDDHDCVLCNRIFRSSLCEDIVSRALNQLTEKAQEIINLTESNVGSYRG